MSVRSNLTRLANEQYDLVVIGGIYDAFVQTTQAIEELTTA